LAVDAEWNEWFLREIERRAVLGGLELRAAIWVVLVDWFKARGAVLTPDELAELERLMADLSEAAVKGIVGGKVDPTVLARLARAGLPIREPLELPALAVRAGALYGRLLSQGPVGFDELRKTLLSQPFTKWEARAVERARTRAALFLRPVFDAAGRIVPIQAELDPIRSAVAEAIRGRISPRKAAAELGKTMRAQGNFRDMHRVMRTEMAEATCRARFESQPGEASTLMYRQVSIRACAECRRLYVQPDGMPRLYTRREVMEQDALGPNTKVPFHARVGPTHPNCACSPWARWVAGMERLFAAARTAHVGGAA
jgi:hypothetical protein